jgi:large subunit ribosomal protein L35
MPRSIARRKTRKAVAKRFKVSAGGKVMFLKPGRRHLAGSKNRKRMRRLGKVAVLAETDVARITENLPFR